MSNKVEFRVEIVNVTETNKKGAPYSRTSRWSQSKTKMDGRSGQVDKGNNLDLILSGIFFAMDS